MSVIGIDLGTTNTVIACVRDGRVHVLADERGNRLLPSVVSFHPNGDVLVGHGAKERRLVDAANTIASIKRLIGRAWDSDEIRLARSRFAFEFREGPGQSALVIARGEAYTLPEISAFVLKRVRQIAEAALGETVDKAVITVPAHFNELQRASTKVAGRVAGLEVLRILNEPTAAALAYGFGSNASERVAVYDFGGGTFDCSLLELSGNLFEVLATSGDTFLGGDDIDTAIAEQMCAAFLLQHRYDPRIDPQAFERLRAAAENLKMELSVNMQAQVEMPDVAYGVGGSPLGLTFGLTQADLDALAEPYVERTLQVTQDALNIAGLAPSSFDRVVLVGGSTRMALVRRRVEAFFGAPALDRVNPDEVVAIGAAIQAAALSDAARRRSVPAPPLPGVLRASAPPLANLDDESDVPTGLHDAFSPPSPRRLPSLPPASKPGTLPPPVAPKRTLRPPLPISPPTAPGRTTTAATPFGAIMPVRGMMDQVEQVKRETEPAQHDDLPRVLSRAKDGAVAEDDSLTRANTLPAAMSPKPRTPPPPPAPPLRVPPPLPPSDAASSARARGDGGPNTHPMPTLRSGDRPQPAPPVPSQRTAGFTLPNPPTPWRGFASVGPLPTEDISLIAPARGPEDPSLPGRSLTGQSFPGQHLPARVGPRSNEPDPSYIVPVGDPRAVPGFQSREPPGGAPVLVDVTPRALVVEVVGGFSDTVIPRNAKIPCEHARVFATGSDMQTVVHVRVAQGESARFLENMYLGELELSGLRPAPRGEVSLTVVFELDADGTLQARAIDTVSGREARAAMKLVAVSQDEAAIEEMIERSVSIKVKG